MDNEYFLSELTHYGIKRRSGRYPYGSGERPYQSLGDYGNELFKNSDKKNLEKFGKSKNTNILYITGLSGSGKSTLALSLKGKNDEVIHLDSYFERKNVKEARKNRNKEFNSFLKKNNFDPMILEDSKMFNEDIKKYFKYVDEFSKLSERFGEEMYLKNKRVIMEGVQIGDETLYGDRSFYNTKPYIALKTDAKIAAERAKKRDMNHGLKDVDNMELNSIFESELIHYGIKRRSGRYPYGSGERPYQSGGGGAPAPPKNKTRKQRKAEEAAAKQAEAKRKHDEAKPGVLQKGSATDVKKYLGELSTQELNDVVRRLNLEKQVKEMSAKETKTNMQKIDNTMQLLKKIDEWTKIGTSMYNTLVGVYNSTEEGRKNPMRRVS